MAVAESPRRALIVLHQAHSTPGRVGRRLQALGVELDIRRPALGDPLPASLEEHDGVIVFGGPMSANDEVDWLRREIDWLSVPLREEKPFLGICLGAQLLARQLGARVYSHPDTRGEVGYYPLHPTETADVLCDVRFPRFAYQWHFDGFDLPKGAELLATSQGDFPVQAYRHGPNAVALQFHPEVTYQMMCRWTTRGHERLTRPGARPREEHLHGWYQHDGAVSAWLGAFLAKWIEAAPPARAAPAGRKAAARAANALVSEIRAA